MSAASQPQSHKNKPRLGRGLSSLLSASELPVEVTVAPDVPPTGLTEQAATGDTHKSPAEIPIDQIAPNPHQPRRDMNQATLAEMAASMKSAGLIQPIIVRKTADGYQLIAGERRLRAARLAGLQTIPAIVRQVDDFTQAQLALIENIHRENLNPIDRAKAYRTLMSQLGLTQQELANRLGEDRSSIANHLRLLDLAEPVQQLILDGKLSLGHAKLLAGVADMLEQQRLAGLCIAQDLSVRNLERMLASQKEPSPRPGSGRLSAHLLDLEKAISRQLGMRVQVRSGKKGRGRLTIFYASLDQFDDLMQRLGVRVD